MCKVCVGWCPGSRLQGLGFRVQGSGPCIGGESYLIYAELACAF